MLAYKHFHFSQFDVQGVGYGWVILSYVVGVTTRFFFSPSLLQITTHPKIRLQLWHYLTWGEGANWGKNLWLHNKTAIPPFSTKHMQTFVWLNRFLQGGKCFTVSTHPILDKCGCLLRNSPKNTLLHHSFTHCKIHSGTLQWFLSPHYQELISLLENLCLWWHQTVILSSVTALLDRTVYQMACALLNQHQQETGYIIVMCIIT